MVARATPTPIRPTATPTAARESTIQTMAAAFTMSPLTSVQRCPKTLAIRPTSSSTAPMARLSRLTRVPICAAEYPMRARCTGSTGRTNCHEIATRNPAAPSSAIRTSSGETRTERCAGAVAGVPPVAGEDCERSFMRMTKTFAR
jgi:hypothetical protein